MGGRRGKVKRYIYDGKGLYVRRDGEGYVRMDGHKRIVEVCYNKKDKVEIPSALVRYMENNFVFKVLRKEDFNLWGEIISSAKFVLEFMLPYIDMNTEVNLEVLRHWNREEAKKVCDQLQELASAISKVKVLYKDPANIWAYYRERYFGWWIAIGCEGRIVMIDDHGFEIKLSGCEYDCKVCGRLHYLLTKATRCILTAEENEEVMQLGKRVSYY
jgi:hypothetical protein